METKNLKVEVKNFGTAVGTTGWFSNYLDGAKIVIGKLKDDGMPCVCLKRENENIVIAFVSNDFIDEGYVDRGEKIYSLHVEDYKQFSRYQHGFTGYATNKRHNIWTI